MTRLITTKDAAERLGLTVQRIHQLIDDGSLPAEKLGRDYVIKEEDLGRVKDRPKVGRPAFITYSDAAQRLGIGIKDVERLVDRGELITKKDDKGNLVVKLDSVNDYLNRKKSKKK